MRKIIKAKKEKEKKGSKKESEIIYTDWDRERGV